MRMHVTTRRPRRHHGGAADVEVPVATRAADTGPQLVVRPERIALALSLVVAALVLGHVMAVVVDRAIGHDVFPGSEVFVRLFSLDGELNVPSWYSASALLGGAGVALLIGCTRSGEPAARGPWLVLAAVLTFLSVDEAAVIHEELSRPLTDQVGLNQADWMFWAWVLPYTGVALVLVLVSWRFVSRLPASTRRMFVVAGGMYVAGAAGLELVGSRLYEDGAVSLAYLTVVGIEETLEMAAVVTFAYALLRYAKERFGPIQLAWSSNP